MKNTKTRRVTLNAWFEKRTKKNENELRYSYGALFFNWLLIALGIRVPQQKLYNVKVDFFTKVRSLMSLFRIYSLSIFACLCVLPFKWSKKLSESYSDEIFLHLIADTSICVQYATSIFYFGSNHFNLYHDLIKDRKKISKSLTNIRDIFVDIRNENLEQISNKNEDFKFLIKQPCKINMRVISLVVSSTIIISFIGSMLTTEVSQYDIYFPFFIISRFYGRGASILNTASFAFVFYKHIKVLNLYAQILEKRDWSTQKYYIVSVMIMNLTRLRES